MTPASCQHAAHQHGNGHSNRGKHRTRHRTEAADEQPDSGRDQTEMDGAAHRGSGQGGDGQLHRRSAATRSPTGGAPS